MLRALARSLTHSIGPYKGIVRKSIDRSIGPYKGIVLKSIDRKSIFIPTCLALLKPMLDLSAEALMLAAESPFTWYSETALFQALQRAFSKLSRLCII